MRQHRRGVTTLLVFSLVAAAPGAAEGFDNAVFTEAETARILAHGPWPPDPVLDPSNRVSGNADAIGVSALSHVDALRKKSSAPETGRVTRSC